MQVSVESTGNLERRMTFQVPAEQLESSVGEVARARVVWTHTPGTQRSRPAEYDADADRWVATWNASGGDAVPPWVGVTYIWEATDTAGNSFQSEPVEVEYADQTREWTRTEGSARSNSGPRRPTTRSFGRRMSRII